MIADASEAKKYSTCLSSPCGPNWDVESTRVRRGAAVVGDNFDSVGGVDVMVGGVAVVVGEPAAGRW